MNFITKYKNRIYLIGLLVAIIFLYIISLTILNFRKSSFYKVINSSFAGVIVEIKDNGFVIQTKSGKREYILIRPDTRILKGNVYSNTENLVIGEYSIIIGNVEPSGVVDAKVLRILKSKLNE